MTDVLRVALVDTMAALALEATDARLDKLLEYLSLLQRWNAVYNLTSVRDPRAMLVQHLADCLAVVGPMCRTAPGVQRVLDVGSGGGLPAVVIAIMLPGLAVTSVDAVGKKVAFIRQVAAELGLSNLDAVHTRIEKFMAPPFDLVTSRAFASLADFVRSTCALVAPQGLWMAMKGRVPHHELTGLPADITVFHVEQLHVPQLVGDRCLVWMEDSRSAALRAHPRPSP